MAVIERRLIEQGRVKCLCGRRATGTTEGGELECDDLSCHAAEEIERVRHQLAGAVEQIGEALKLLEARRSPSGQIPLAAGPAERVLALLRAAAGGQ